MESINEYDVIVVGSGHAGVEAAYVAAKLNKRVALVTFSERDVAFLHCNVSIGGSAKGIVVRELFALGGLMPIAADETQLQTKILNQSKGAAVQSLRAQVDKVEYPKYILKTLKNIDNLDLIFDEVLTLDIIDKTVKGVFLKKNKYLKAKAVVLATGTFLNSKTMRGKTIKTEGPDGKETNLTISEQFKQLNIELIRLKTGTPPRIAKDSIDFSVLQEEPGSMKPIYFTEDYMVEKEYETIPAWLAYTNPNTHKIIENNFDKSYLFSTEITGTGPRYCPSIEDKVKRFNTKERHQIFLELESKITNSIYLSGLSSSMPQDVQEKFVRSIKGLENAKFLKYAYAIEYDSVNPFELKQTLEFKKINNLFTAGQINGTSGYEEAAGQGFIAGINASNKVNGERDFILNRDEAYIGVMVDDITTKGVEDPYRLLTSRAEYRLLLRSDNVVKRLYKKAFDYNLISQERYDQLDAKFNNLEVIKEKFKEFKLDQRDLRFKEILEKRNITRISLLDYINRSGCSLFDLLDLVQKDFPELLNYSDTDLFTFEIEIKYRGYIAKQEREVQKYLKFQKLLLTEDFDYQSVPNLAQEAVEKLTKFKPRSIHQASHIQGINLSDIMFLVHHINRSRVSNSK